jgi:hypothetical protein
MGLEGASGCDQRRNISRKSGCVFWVLPVDVEAASIGKIQLAQTVIPKET